MTRQDDETWIWEQLERRLRWAKLLGVNPGSLPPEINFVILPDEDGGSPDNVDFVREIVRLRKLRGGK